MYSVTDTAQVELKSGRVQALAVVSTMDVFSAPYAEAWKLPVPPFTAAAAAAARAPMRPHRVLDAWLSIVATGRFPAVARR